MQENARPPMATPADPSAIAAHQAERARYIAAYRADAPIITVRRAVRWALFFGAKP